MSCILPLLTKTFGNGYCPAHSGGLETPAHAVYGLREHRHKSYSARRPHRPLRRLAPGQWEPSLPPLQRAPGPESSNAMLPPVQAIIFIFILQKLFMYFSIQASGPYVPPRSAPGHQGCYLLVGAGQAPRNPRYPWGPCRGLRWRTGLRKAARRSGVSVIQRGLCGVCCTYASCPA